MIYSILQVKEEGTVLKTRVVRKLQRQTMVTSTFYLYVLIYLF